MAYAPPGSDPGWTPNKAPFRVRDAVRRHGGTNGKGILILGALTAAAGLYFFCAPIATVVLADALLP